MTVEDQREYELVMVLTPEADEAEIAAAIDRLSSFITERGGSVSEQQTWGLRRLAYPIRNFQEGHYVLARFGMAAKDVPELDRSLNATESVLRHLVTLAHKVKATSE